MTANARPVFDRHLPAIHLNGSGRQALVAQQKAIYRALDAAYVALSEATPHMRDYYILADGEDRYRIARDEHARRMGLVQALRNDAIHDYQRLIDPDFA